MSIKSFLRKNRYRLLVIFERLRGLDFSKQLDNERIGVNKSEGNYFSSSAYFEELRTLLRELNISSKDGIFDFGFGKGATLVLFNKFPFGRIAGVELSDKLVKIAESNLEKLKIKKVKLIHENATTCKDLDDYNYFYFYNPFPGEVMSVVLENIKESIERSPRVVRLIYCNPEFHASVVASNAFFLEKTFDSEVKWGVINLYKSSSNVD
ncbi:hypothetical protein VRU48_17105 [Pedobacter sp. KR3-3]|uniref:Methyltransferase domain-containing protein n=1 Tax=Pedobacter albus TaxID=3113905 RepID=A0ABU7IBK9_9SPHI|nr:hypothetical protein [Pedobacter sp. KR3-3]MEE1946847.1 hypothetical protein [Pedobacter sp. KR3-3]